MLRHTTAFQYHLWHTAFPPAFLRLRVDRDLPLLAAGERALPSDTVEIVIKIRFDHRLHIFFMSLLFIYQRIITDIIVSAREVQVNRFVFLPSSLHRYIEVPRKSASGALLNALCVSCRFGITASVPAPTPRYTAGNKLRRSSSRIHRFRRMVSVLLLASPDPALPHRATDKPLHS